MIDVRDLALEIVINRGTTSTVPKRVHRRWTLGTITSLQIVSRTRTVVRNWVKQYSTIGFNFTFVFSHI